MPEIYILFIIPLALSALQCFLLFTVFRYDTPPMIHQSHDHVKLKEFMSKIYHPMAVQDKIDELSINDTSAQGDDVNEVGYGEACCSPLYSRSTFVGCSLAIFQ